MTNLRIALTFERIDDLQGASPFHIRGWREAAHGVREDPRELAEVSGTMAASSATVQHLKSAAGPVAM